MSHNNKLQSNKQDEQISRPADAKPRRQTTLMMLAAPKQAHGASRPSEKVKATPSKVSPAPKTTEAGLWQSPSPTKSPRDGIDQHYPSKNTLGKAKGKLPSPKLSKQSIGSMLRQDVVEISSGTLGPRR